ncbi:MAG: hypothetical protein FGM27_03280 [Candidatus Omnitrophica bacterium]|nr:hypothetical protein [Candidatus Omnitrophota bacterium]
MPEAYLQAPALPALFILPWILLILFILRPGGAEKSYELNRKYALRFLPGKWKEKDFFVNWTRRLGLIWLAVLTALLAAGMH